MKVGDIRSRIWLAALVPVTVIVLMLVGVFLAARIADNEQVHNQRSRLLARQLALASEYGLFSGNIGHLQTIASSALRDPDIRSIAILNPQGEVLVRAGVRGYRTVPVELGQETQAAVPDQDTELLSQPVTASQVKLDDLFAANAAPAGAAPAVLGNLLIEFSHQRMRQRERELLLLGLELGLIGMLLGGWLAVRLARGVIRPVLRVSSMIERIGQGELGVRATVLTDDPLREMQIGLNRMAERLEFGRDELERRIDSATLALREKKEEAESATLAKSRFLAAASHDLRQPTHALGMFVARLGQLKHNAETTHLIENLEVAVQATQDLLNGLLDISRLDAMAVQVQVHAFALSDIFDRLHDGLALTATEKGLRLRIRAANVGLMSDPTLLYSILLNLVGNALRYTHQGGVLLACRVSADRKHARIEVWDTGIGIAPEHHQAIFKEFYQVGNTERNRARGLGLGLNIVERTAQLLGHRLQMCSRPGVGTRFSIEVPLSPPGTSLARASAFGARATEDIAGLVVLVVEDDPLAREGLVSLLASWGAVVLAADGLAAALNLLNEGETPDVIISDYRLAEGETGIETIHLLRVAAGQWVPACLMSGDTDPGLIQAARDAGLTLLHKPVRPAKLRSLIRRLSRRGHADGVALV